MKNYCLKCAGETEWKQSLQAESPEAAAKAFIEAEGLTRDDLIIVVEDILFGTQTKLRPSELFPERDWEPATPPSAEPQAESVPEITRRSPWAVVWIILALLCFVMGVMVALITLTPLFFLGSLFAGIQCLFLAFLTDVLTDIRWFLKQLTERNEDVSYRKD